MVVLWRLAFLAASCLVSSAIFAGTSPAGRPSITVQQGDWGDASLRDIQVVLDSVSAVLAPHFPRHISARVVVAYSAAGPRVLARKSPDGAHVVLLNVRDRRWDQFAYQFSHELCHIFSNYDQRPIAHGDGSREHQWFEEAVCETVSLLTLNRLAEIWKTSAPHAGWEGYAPAFREYAARLLAREHRRLADEASVARLYARHQPTLAANPYLRETNEQLATALLAVFDSSPAALAAIGYLNLESPGKQSFAAYLATWYECCPEEHRAVVRRLMSLFAAA